MVSRGSSSDARCCSVCVVMLDNFCLVSSRLTVLWRITFKVFKEQLFKFFHQPFV